MFIKPAFIKNLIFPFLRSLPIRRQPTTINYPFTTSLTQQLIDLSNNPSQQTQEDFSDLAKNYLELTEESFYQYVKK